MVILNVFNFTIYVLFETSIEVVFATIVALLLGATKGGGAKWGCPTLLDLVHTRLGHQYAHG